MVLYFTENICTILNARALTVWRRKLDVTKESSCASVTNKFHSGKLCSGPPTKVSRTTMASADSKFDDFCLRIQFEYKYVNALIARDFSGFTCTRSLTMNSKFSILHLAASCGIEISRSSLVNCAGKSR